MKVIKISNPWWDEFYHFNINENKTIGNFRFEINNNCDVCDYWIVWGGVKQNESVHCSKNNVIFLTSETVPEITYRQKFLDQFGAVITCRTDIRHKKIVKADHDLGAGAWHFRKLKYKDVVELKPFTKSLSLSVVSSDLTTLTGHKRRFAFVNKLIGHFKDRIDVFGRGFNYIEDKFDGIANYKYSVAIENSIIPGYFTEKLYECFLTYTMPIYYGCPNISSFFDPKAMLLIDLDDYVGSIRRIEQAMEENLYEKSIPFINYARQTYLEKYHIYASLTKIINSYSAPDTVKRRITVLPEKEMLPLPRRVFEKAYGIYKNKF